MHFTKIIKYLFPKQKCERISLSKYSISTYSFNFITFTMEKNYYSTMLLLAVQHSYPLRLV